MKRQAPQASGGCSLSWPFLASSSLSLKCLSVGAEPENRLLVSTAPSHRSLPTPRNREDPLGAQNAGFFSFQITHPSAPFTAKLFETLWNILRVNRVISTTTV